ncbi:unnamed protein product [Urochloa humidicola]
MALSHLLRKMGQRLPPVGGLPAIAAAVVPRSLSQLSGDLAPSSAAVVWRSATCTGFKFTGGLEPPAAVLSSSSRLAAGLAPPSAPARSATLTTGAGSACFQERFLARGVAAADILATRASGFLARGTAAADVLATRAPGFLARGAAATDVLATRAPGFLARGAAAADVLATRATGFLARQAADADILATRVISGNFLTRVAAATNFVSTATITASPSLMTGVLVRIAAATAASASGDIVACAPAPMEGAQSCDVEIVPSVEAHRCSLASLDARPELVASRPRPSSSGGIGGRVVVVRPLQGPAAPLPRSLNMTRKMSSRTAAKALVRSDTKEGTPVQSDAKDKGSHVSKPNVIDQSSALGFCDVNSYVKKKPVLVKDFARGRANTSFRRVSEDMKRVSRNLVQIFKSQHSIGKVLDGSVTASNVWICIATGRAQLRDVTFTDKSFSLQRVQQGYIALSKVLKEVVYMWGGQNALANAPSDYIGFLSYLENNVLAVRDEFVAENHCALVPISNRSDVFLMFYNHIMQRVGKKKKLRILRGLSGASTYFAQAKANTLIAKWLVKRKYKKSNFDQMKMNRNIRCHAYDYTKHDIEIELYYEYPDLLTEIQLQLHSEQELEMTQIHRKFGQ